MFEAIFQFWDVGEDGSEGVREGKQTNKQNFISDSIWLCYWGLRTQLKGTMTEKKQFVGIKAAFDGSNFLPSWMLTRSASNIYLGILNFVPLGCVRKVSWIASFTEGDFYSLLGIQG